MKNTTNAQPINIDLGYWLHYDVMTKEETFDDLCEALQKQGYIESKARSLIMKQVLNKDNFGFTINCETKKLVGFTKTSILTKDGVLLGTICDVMNLDTQQKKR